MAWLISTNLKSEIPQRDDTELENVKLTARERRFIKFASVEFDDQLYMTPQDFLVVNTLISNQWIIIWMQ